MILKSIQFVFFLVHSAVIAQHCVLENSLDVLNLTGCQNTKGSIQIVGDGNFENHQASFISETCLEEIDITLDIEITSFDYSQGIHFAVGKKSKLAGTMIEFFEKGGRGNLVVSRMNNNSLTEAAKFELPFSFRLGENYKIRVGKRIRHLQLEIISNNSYFFNDTLCYPETFFGLFWGTPFVSCKFGEIKLREFVISTPYSKNPRLAVWGDSFIEGSSLLTSSQRYISMVSDRIGHESIAIMGRGGETTSSLNSRFRRELQWFSKAQFGLLAIGVNDTNFESWKKVMLLNIMEMRNSNMIPILVTLSPRSDRQEFIKLVNNWIRNTYEGLYVDVSKSVAVDDVRWLPGMCLGDSIHPSAEGHQAIFNRFEIELPFLFRTEVLFSLDYKNERTSEIISSNMLFCCSNDQFDFKKGQNKRVKVVPGTIFYIRDTTSFNARVFKDVICIPPRPQSPVIDLSNKEPGVFNWLFHPDFSEISDYEFSIDNEQTWRKCKEKPIRNARVEGVHIRIKATRKNFRSPSTYLTNT